MSNIEFIIAWLIGPMVLCTSLTWPMRVNEPLNHTPFNDTKHAKGRLCLHVWRAEERRECESVTGGSKGHGKELMHRAPC